MARWTIVFLLAGCSTVPAASRGLLAEWHAWDQAYRLDPVHEHVRVYDDGLVEARFFTTGALSSWNEFAPRERRFRLSPLQREALDQLLREIAKLKHAPDEHTDLICVLMDPVESIFRSETVLRHRPASGEAWELKRSFSDLDVPFWRMNADLRRRLEAADGLFRELLWKD